MGISDLRIEAQTDLIKVGQSTETEKLALKKIEDCQSKPVLFSVKTSISYKGHIDDDSPISGKVG